MVLSSKKAKIFSVIKIGVHPPLIVHNLGDATQICASTGVKEYDYGAAENRTAIPKLGP